MFAHDLRSRYSSAATPIGALLVIVAIVCPSSPALRAQAQIDGDRPAIVAPAVIDPLMLEGLGSLLPWQRIEAVLTFHSMPTPVDLTVIRAMGVELVSFRALPMVGVRGTPAQIRALFNLAGLRSVYYNRQLTYFLDESVPLIGADRVSQQWGVTGAGVVIAIVDSGVDATHADLAFGAKVIQNVKVAPNLFGPGPLVLQNLPNSDTNSGHGTHVASTAAGTGAALGGKYRGVAIGADLVGVSAGDVLWMLSALQGLDWVLQNHAAYRIRVINNSWGTHGAFSMDDPINVATQAAHDQGMTVVFAAGNDGPYFDTLNPYCVAAWVICVAAGNKDGRTLADFSSRGIPGDSLYHPTITAPGVNIAAARATTGIFLNTYYPPAQLGIGFDAAYYAVLSGTSQATPHVSGTVALMLAANPELTPDGIKALLIATATAMPGYGEAEVGAGYLNAYEAVSAAQP